MHDLDMDIVQNPSTGVFAGEMEQVRRRYEERDEHRPRSRRSDG